VWARARAHVRGLFMVQVPSFVLNVRAVFRHYAHI